MKSIHLVAVLVSAVLVFAGCGKKEASTNATATTPTATEPPATNTAATPAPAGARVIEIVANDQMKFSVTRIEATPGEELKIVLVNQGTQPKQVMGHNWVLLAAGVSVDAYAQKAIAAVADEYVPKATKDQVLAHTKLLGPKQRDEVTFKAPSAAGEYGFLCTFPAHAQLGMKGVLVVK